MAAMAGLIHHSLSAGQAANPMAAGAASGAATSSTSSSSSSSATISANDFLTLLVTEMKNQDPTADSDPNAYINQLVSVNSLEQLIDINQNLTTALGTTSGNTGTGSTSSIRGASATGASATGATAAATTASAPASSNALSGTGAHRPGASAASSGGGSKLVSAIHEFAGAPMARSANAPAAPGNLGIPEGHAAARKVGHALDGKSHSHAHSGKPAEAQ